MLVKSESCRWETTCYPSVKFWRAREWELAEGDEDPGRRKLVFGRFAWGWMHVMRQRWYRLLYNLLQDTTNKWNPSAMIDPDLWSSMNPDPMIVRNWIPNSKTKADVWWSCLKTSHESQKERKAHTADTREQMRGWFDILTKMMFDLRVGMALQKERATISDYHSNEINHLRTGFRSETDDDVDFFFFIFFITSVIFAKKRDFRESVCNSESKRWFQPSLPLSLFLTAVSKYALLPPLRPSVPVFEGSPDASCSCWCSPDAATFNKKSC